MSTAAATTVLVVGAGPTGLTAAHLLGSLGVPVLVVERNPGTSDDAKAISLDDESLRTLQLAGVDDAIYPIIVPGTGTRYFGRRGQTLVHARGAGGNRFGHPFKNPFAQPDLERVLRDELDRYPTVRARFNTRLVGLTQQADRVRVALRTADDPENDEHLDVAYVLACDGGRSTVRELLSIPMSGRSFADVWLVADTLDDPHDERYGMHYGDPERPAVIVPGRDGRCRYEFLLKPGEGTPGAPPPFELVRDLVRPFRTLAPEQVERAVNYTFNAVLADRLRDGRCFLLGDAAHMMPPFAGQGLNSGLRDAANLSWKIADVLAGRATDALLDTYESERRPHAEAMIKLSVRLGEVVMTTSRRRARLRDLVIGAAVRTRRGRRYFTEMRYRPASRVGAGAIVAPGPGRGQELVGRPLPQPQVWSGRSDRLTRLDDVLSRGWSLLGVGVTDTGWDSVGRAALPPGTRIDVVLDDRAPRERSGRRAVADADGALDALLDGLAGHFVLVRPDRLVAAVFTTAHAPEVAVALHPFVATGLPDAGPTDLPPVRSRTGPLRNEPVPTTEGAHR